MIKQILIHLSQGTHTIAELAQKLHVNKEDMINHLEMMELMGYLQKTNITANKGRTQGPGKMCAFCPKAKGCSNMTTSTNGVTYKLTPKGKRVCVNS